MSGQEVHFNLHSNPKEFIPIKASAKIGRIKNKNGRIEKWSWILQVIRCLLRYFFLRIDAFKKGQQKEFDISTEMINKLAE